MIVGPDWIWLHVPKCAGTTTEAILRAAFGGRRGYAFDEIDTRGAVIWHQTVAARRAMDAGFDPGQRRVIGNLRRLPYWLLSRVMFEVQRRGEIAAPPRGQLLRGRFLQLRHGAKTDSRPQDYRLFSADDMLASFAAEVTHWVRSEHLTEDLARVLPLSADDPALQTESRNATKVAQVKSLGFWFTPNDLAGLYAANPVWADLERRVYGDILSL